MDHKHVCEVCDAKFSNSENKERHLKEVHGNPEVKKCSRCSHTFVRKEDLAIHVKNIHDKSAPSYKCEECAKVFNKIGNLNRHKNDVHGKDKFFPGKYFRCPKPGCPEKFTRKSNHERHIKRGKHSALVTCHFCDKSVMYRSKAEKKKHFVNKWGERPHSCISIEKSKDPTVQDDTRYHTWF